MAVTTNESTDALYGGGEIVAWCSEDDAGQDAGSGDASAVLEASLRERIADIREGVGAESLREELMHAADNQMLTADTLNVLFGELLAKEAELGITVEAAAGQTA